MNTQMDAISLSETAQLRMRIYRSLLLLDAESEESLEDQQALWHEAERMAARLMKYKGETAEEEAELCLTLLLTLQVGIRDFGRIAAATDRALAVLPHLADGSLRTALLVLLHAETEDETLLAEIQEAFFRQQEVQDTTREEGYVRALSCSMAEHSK